MRTGAYLDGMFLFRLAALCLRALALAMLVGAGLAFAAVPSPYRAFTPDLFGLEELSPGVYADDPGAAARIEALIGQAEDRTRDFFGELEVDPAWVVCSTADCAASFGLSANGLTFGFHLIVIGPGGMNDIVFTHERVHAELHRWLVPSDLLGPRFPAWFDEGLASHLSGDSRLWQPADARRADWIREATNFFKWRQLREGRDWRDSYGAAARLVAEIEQRLGRDGLRALIEEVGEGADFETVLAREMGG